MAVDKNHIDDELYRLVVDQTKDYAVFVLDPTGHVMLDLRVYSI